MAPTAKPTRPATESNHLVHDVEAGQAAGLVVSKVDRLSTTRTRSTVSGVARSARLESGRGEVSASRSGHPRTPYLHLVIKCWRSGDQAALPAILVVDTSVEENRR